MEKGDDSSDYPQQAGHSIDGNSFLRGQVKRVGKAGNMRAKGRSVTDGIHYVGGIVRGDRDSDVRSLQLPFGGCLQ